ncbi:excalibur calcium-binding domain-containing protein [Sphingobium fuliginis]|uniref:excalibur calcium-binding domain-containing protein n=1 Tax=Sphingobium fuliginis (strain ATCC 27551) TaxID=336203 RepID=UPI0009F2B067|nr:excalibur calcium-binding domain-containing protein [Sphingobium fuliginis]
MRGKKNDNLIGFIAIGAFLFALGRCSAEGPKPVTDPAPVALMSSDAVASQGNSSDTPVEAPPEPAPEQAALVSSRALEELGSRNEGPSCGSKHLCRQMNSCEEAYHYLNECGVGRLDGDGDGVPCESIC